MLLVVTVIYLSQELYKRYQINQEIAGLQREITRLEGKNKEILGLIDYFKTREYKERQARSLLNLQKPGEFAVALPPSTEESAPAATSGGKEAKESNLKQWRRYFFPE